MNKTKMSMISNIIQDETAHALYIYIYMEEQLKVFEAYKHKVHPNFYIHIAQIENEIGIIQLKMALAKAIICKNTMSSQEQQE